MNTRTLGRRQQQQQTGTS
uniref:Uncharacterized protein n=1 Tax=Arundo donax TaxID=35708 RepID=A0A0A8YSC0_ARUDO